MKFSWPAVVRLKRYTSRVIPTSPIPLLAALGSERIDVAEIVAVVDTNVLIETHSFHDIARARPGTEDSRMELARNSLLLAIHLHQKRAITYSLYEIAEVMMARVPVDQPTLERLFAGVFAHFVKDLVLDGWDSRVWAGGNPRSSEADRHLIDRAEEIERPLITRDSRMTSGARERGVTVHTPEEFWRREGLDVERSTRRFLARFRALAPQYARQRDPDQFDARMRHLLDLYGFYRKLLLERG